MSGKKIAREASAPVHGATEKRLYVPPRGLAFHANPEEAEKLKKALRQESDSVASRVIAQVIKDQRVGPVMKNDSPHFQTRLTIEKRTSGVPSALERVGQVAVELLGKLPLSRLLRAPMPETERLAQLFAHNTQIEQLAQEIIKYRVMMDVPGGILIAVMEISTRFTESPDDVREAFRLLHAKGTAQPTEFKDRWVLHC